MTPVEILALIQSTRTLIDLGMSQYHLAEQAGKLTDQQKADILAAANMTDTQVDQAIESARERLTPSTR